jgi:hypothetical protein
MAVLLSTLFAVPAAACFAGLTVIAEGMYFFKSQHQFTLNVGLAQEVWIPLVKENFYPSNSFLSAAMDMSAMVDNDVINLAEAGADPTVLKNNTTYPITSAVAADTPLALALDYYDTNSTIVRNAIAVELAYDQRALYASKHQKALLKKVGQDAAYVYAPTQTNAGNLNLVLNLAGGDSFIDGIIDLRKHYDSVDHSGSDRILVLDPNHMAKISKEDKALYKAIIAQEGGSMYGFRIFTYSNNPIYTTAGVKAAQGTAFVGGTHKYGSFAFLADEVMKAMGTIKLFSTLNDPAQKGDVFNFQMRFYANTIRGKYMGAIIQ